MARFLAESELVALQGPCVRSTSVPSACFWKVEAERCNWSQPELKRQIHSHLFARLLKSRDKVGVLQLSRQGQVLERPIDVIKHPYVLDFLDLPEAHRLHESALEAAIIEKLQPFLLEMGRGFAFVARQQRISTESQHFYIDLVFYNYLLKCFVLIDLKMGRLTPGCGADGHVCAHVRRPEAQARATTRPLG